VKSEDSLCVAATFRAENERTGFPQCSPERRMKESFIYRRLIRPILELLRQSVTPEKLALSLALGLVLSVFPSGGLDHHALRTGRADFSLNLPAIQLIKLFHVPGADRASCWPFFPARRKGIPGAASADLHSPHLPNGPRQPLGRHQVPVEHDVARDGGLGCFLRRCSYSAALLCPPAGVPAAWPQRIGASQPTVEAEAA